MYGQFVRATSLSITQFMTAKKPVHVNRHVQRYQSINHCGCHHLQSNQPLGLTRGSTLLCSNKGGQQTLPNNRVCTYLSRHDALFSLNSFRNGHLLDGHCAADGEDTCSCPERVSRVMAASTCACTLLLVRSAGRLHSEQLAVVASGLHMSS